jgi:biotin carboxylase
MQIIVMKEQFGYIHVIIMEYGYSRVISSWVRGLSVQHNRAIQYPLVRMVIQLLLEVALIIVAKEQFGYIHVIIMGYGYSRVISLWVRELLVQQHKASQYR